MTRRVVSAVAIMLVGAFLTACTSNGPLPPALKSGNGDLRTDLEALTSRFPILDTNESVSWMSGTMGSDRAPGPSTYWIDAVVTLPAAEHTALAELGTLSAAVLPDDFSAGLLDSVPVEELRTSPELDEVFSQDGFWSEALLVDDGVTLILTTKFE